MIIKLLLEIVKEGAKETVAIWMNIMRINDKLWIRGSLFNDADKMNKLLDCTGEVQDKIDASNAWELDNKLEMAMDALRTHPKIENQ